MTTSDDVLFLKSLNILYVEDDRETRAQLSEFLMRHVGGVSVAENGEEGLDAFRKRPSDMVVTDILMPVMDGLEMAVEIRKEAPELPIIITTAFQDEEYFLRAIEIGVDGYVLKPTFPRELVKAILKSARLLREKRKVAQTRAHADYVLDIHPNLLMVVEGDRIDYLNQPFLTFLGMDSLEEFLENGSAFGFFITDKEGRPLVDREGGDWIDLLMNAPDRDPILYLRSPREPDRPPRPFTLGINTPPMEPNRRIISLTDIADIESHINVLEGKARTDPVTGACAQARLRGQLEAEIKRAQRHGGTFSLILMALDRADDGETADGGAILRQTATQLANNLRASDSVTRWDGTGFLILLPEVGLEGARLAAEKCRLALEKFDFPGAEEVTGSFGAIEHRAGETVESLIERAEGTLAFAQQKGPNRVEAG